jgi:hypothetical protein
MLSHCTVIVLTYTVLYRIPDSHLLMQQNFSILARQAQVRSEKAVTRGIGKYTLMFI